MQLPPGLMTIIIRPEERWSLDVKEAMALTGIGRTKFYAMLHNDEIPADKFGKKWVIRAEPFARMFGVEIPPRKALPRDERTRRAYARTRTVHSRP